MTLLSSLQERFGQIDILINSAGINIRGPIDRITPEEFRRVQEVNVTGTWLACRAVIPGMKERNYGRIVNMASMLSVVTIADRTPYASSKGAVLQLTRALAVELAPLIAVNAVAPAMIAAPPHLSLDDIEAIRKASLLERIGTPEDANNLVLYLLEGTDFATGSIYRVDGGRFLAGAE